mmetsp:Transcript_45074/g.94198  ORF Transcript_45074/g.94198 Transcript_45074/m.94198 type:complete len:137 (-) Transcript_45074:774-1184(-)
MVRLALRAVDSFVLRCVVPAPWAENACLSEQLVESRWCHHGQLSCTRRLWEPRLRDQRGEGIVSRMVQAIIIIVIIRAASKKAVLPLLCNDRESLLADSGIGIVCSKQNVAVDDFAKNVGLFQFVLWGMSSCGQQW